MEKGELIQLLIEALFIAIPIIWLLAWIQEFSEDDSVSKK